VVHTALKEAAACMTTDVIRIVFFKPWPPPAYIHTTELSVVVQPVRTPRSTNPNYCIGQFEIQTLPAA
jgi:hypothetical protein